MVELSEGLELSVGEEPELQHGAREVRVYSTSGELYQRRQGKCHLVQFVSEFGVLGETAAQGALVVAVVRRQATVMHHDVGW